MTNCSYVQYPDPFEEPCTILVIDNPNWDVPLQIADDKLSDRLKPEIKDIVIEHSTKATTIAKYAFYSCSHIERVTIKAPIETIQAKAFQHCSRLSAIIFEFPLSLTGFGVEAFSTCESLHSFHIPAGVTTLDDYAFAYCRQLSSITLHDNITQIGRGMFGGCPIESITLIETHNPTLILSGRFLVHATTKHLLAYMRQQGVDDLIIVPEVEVLPTFPFALDAHTKRIIFHSKITQIQFGGFGTDHSQVREIIFPEDSDLAQLGCDDGPFVFYDLSVGIQVLDSVVFPRRCQLGPLDPMSLAYLDVKYLSLPDECSFIYTSPDEIGPFNGIVESLRLSDPPHDSFFKWADSFLYSLTRILLDCDQPEPDYEWTIKIDENSVEFDYVDDCAGITRHALFVIDLVKSVFLTFPSLCKIQ